MKWLFAFMLMLVFCAGCTSNDSAPPPSPTQPAKQTPVVPPSSPALSPPAAAPASPTAESKASEETTPQVKTPEALPAKAPANMTAGSQTIGPEVPAKATPAEPAIQQRPGTELKQAEQGVGEKGHYEPGIITTPVSVFFSARERIAFEIQVPHAMQLFKAMEDRNPKDQTEFMQKIIKANGIKLPELPPGHRYLYNPKTAQLMVEYPRPQPPPAAK
jgi:hypothetical protein